MRLILKTERNNKEKKKALSKGSECLKNIYILVLLCFLSTFTLFLNTFLLIKQQNNTSWVFSNCQFSFIQEETKKNPQNRGEKNGKNRGRDSKESGKGGNKKKKTPNRSTTVPTITTSMVT